MPSTTHLPSSTPRPILAEYLKYCSPVVLEEPWDALSLDPVAYSALASPFFVLAQLQARFDRTTLIESGLAVPCGEELIWPAPFCMPDGSPVVPLRREPSETPFSLICDAGAIRGGEGTLPLLDALDDGATSQALADLDGSLLVTPEFEDMIILRSLGFPATTSSGLTTLNAEQLRLLQTAFSWKRGCNQDPSSLVLPAQRPKDENSQDDNGKCDTSITDVPNFKALIGESQTAIPQIILVGFQLRQLSLEYPPGLAQLVESLASLQRDFDLLPSVWLWTPTDHEVRRLARCRELGDVTYVREAVLDSLDTSCYEMVVPEAPEEVPDLVTARAELLQAEAAMVGKEADRVRLERARRSFDAAVDRDIGRPIVERAMSYANPLDRALGSLAGNLAQQAQLQGIQIIARQRRIQADSAQDTNPQVIATTVDREYFRTIKMLLDVRKGLNR